MSCYKITIEVKFDRYYFTILWGEVVFELAEKLENVDNHDDRGSCCCWWRRRRLMAHVRLFIISFSTNQIQRSFVHLIKLTSSNHERDAFEFLNRFYPKFVADYCGKSNIDIALPTSTHIVSTTNNKFVECSTKQKFMLNEMTIMRLKLI